MLVCNKPISFNGAPKPFIVELDNHVMDPFFGVFTHMPYLLNSIHFGLFSMFFLNIPNLLNIYIGKLASTRYSDLKISYNTTLE
jgi:hypothetical protein